MHFRLPVIPLQATPVVAVLAIVTGAGATGQGQATVACWGSDIHGQSTVPQGLGPCNAVAGGAAHTVALRADGTVACWGSNQYMQAAVPPGLPLCSAIAAGWNHTIAISTTGGVYAWGLNQDGQVDVPTGLPPIASAAGGDGHSLVLGNDGQVRAWGRNDVGQSSPPVDLGVCVKIAGGRDHSVALTADGRVRCWGLTAPGVNGSGRARQFILDVLAGTDSVDLLWCGDSNTGFSDGSTPVSGWCDGVAVALNERGARQYATPLLPVNAIGESFGRWSMNWSMPLGTGWTGGQSTAVNVSGLANAPADLVESLTSGAPPGELGLHPNGVPFDFSFIPRQTYPFFIGNSGVSIYPDSPLDTRETLHYRVLRGELISADSPGHYFQGWQYDNGVTLIQPARREIVGLARRWVADELTLPADPGRAPLTVRATLGGGAAGQDFGISGNAPLGLQSVRRDAKGWASQPLEYHSGATMTKIARDVTMMPIASRMTWLGELVDRQRASGGSGRVIVWVQGGVNSDAGTPESWGTAVLAIKAALESAWITMDRSLDDITFVAMVSHPISEADGELLELRAYAATLPGTIPNLTILDLSQLALASESASHDWHSAGGMVHLSGAGYTNLSGRLVDALLGRLSPIDVPVDCALPGSCRDISASALGTLVLRTDGTIRYWGSPKGGLADIPVSASGSSKIAAGSMHALALSAQGHIVAWGANGNEQTETPPNLPDSLEIAAGGSHSCAIAFPAAPCPGDWNLDGYRDATDLTPILSGWGTPVADVNGDGTTDGFDLSFLLAGWGPCPAP